MPQTAWVSLESVAVEIRVAVRGCKNQLPAEGLGTQDPRLSSSAEWEKKCCYIQRNWGSICCSLFQSPTHLSHLPFCNPLATISNKVWELYFSKEVCSFAIVVDYVSACICNRIVVSRLYNIPTLALFSSVFPNRPGESYQRLKKMVLDAALLNIIR